VPDSYSPLQIEIIFVTDTLKVQIPAENYFQSLSIEQRMGGAWAGALTLFDPNSAYLEDLILAAGPQGAGRGVLVRWGWTHDAEGNYIPLSKQRVFEGRIATYTSEFAVEGLTLKLDMVHAGILNTMVDGEAAPTHSWSGQMTASGIVRDIAEQQGWQTSEKGFYTNRKTFTRETVEDTDGPIGESIVKPADMDFVTFIREFLLPRAVNKDKTHFTFGLVHTAPSKETTTGLRVRKADYPSVVHFHSPEFDGASSGGLNRAKGETKRQIMAAKSYIFGRDNMGEVISFSPSDDTLLVALQGHSNSIYKGLDSLKGEQIIFETQELEGFPGATKVVTVDTEYTTEVGGERVSAIPLIARTGEDLERKAAAQFSRVGQSGYTATLEVRGTHDMRVFDYIEVIYYRRGETMVGDDQTIPTSDWFNESTPKKRQERARAKAFQKHYLSGLYHVRDISHELSASGWVTTCELQRSGHAYVGPDATKRPVDISVEAQSVEGQRREDMIPAEVRRG